MHEYSKMSNYTAFSNISRSLSFDRNTTIIYGVYEYQQQSAFQTQLTITIRQNKNDIEKRQNVGLTSVILMVLCAN